MITTAIHFLRCIILAAKAGAHQREAIHGIHFNGWLLDWLGNIRLVWVSMAVANTLAYYDRQLLQQQKKLCSTEPKGLHNKTF